MLHVGASPIVGQPGSGALLNVGDGSGASCYLGYSSGGPSLYYNFGKNVVSLAVGVPALGVHSWRLTMHPDVILGIVGLTIGYTLSSGYTNPEARPVFKIRDFGPGFTANSVQIEVYLVDGTGAPIDPSTVLGNTGYVGFTMQDSGVRSEEKPI